ncbi:MAG: sigma-70 family RNA polymerase sigma factor [Acidobacteria bacterium]|nr:sigma-70 family RNA polymerase sigma factor [Acidobacteriota bacterium]
MLEMYEQHSAWLLRFARMATGREDGSLAQDGVQEAFFRYFVFRREGNTVDDPRKWLQQYLKEYLERALARSARDERVRAESGGGTSGMQEMLFDVQRRLPQLLSPRELQAMRLRAEGFRYAEIADALSVTVGTVGTMIARAVKKLQSEFGPRENLKHGRSDE